MHWQIVTTPSHTKLKPELLAQQLGQLLFATAHDGKIGLGMQGGGGGGDGGGVGGMILPGNDGPPAQEQSEVFPLHEKLKPE